MRHIDVAPALLHRHLDRCDTGSDLFRRISRPRRTAERASDPAALRLRPLIKACFVDIVATCGAAPDDFLVIFKLHAADWAIGFDWLAVTVFRLVVCDLRWQGGSAVEDLAEFGRQEGILVQQIFRSLQHMVKDVDNVLAALLTALFGEDAHWAVASRCMRDGDSIDVASRSGNLDNFARAVVVIGMAVVFHTALTVKDEHALSDDSLEEFVEGLVRLVNETAIVST